MIIVSASVREVVGRDISRVSPRSFDPGKRVEISESVPET